MRILTVTLAAPDPDTLDFIPVDLAARIEALLRAAFDELLADETRDLVVLNEHIAVDSRHQRLHGAFGQMLLHACH